MPPVMEVVATVLVAAASNFDRGNFEVLLLLRHSLLRVEMEFILLLLLLPSLSVAAGDGAALLFIVVVPPLLALLIVAS